MEKLFKNFMKKLKLPKASKKSDVMSCVLCMILVVIASQSRVFDFFIESNLGRMVLLALVFTICCTSKIFGAASVLFLVLAFAVHINRERVFNLEGMCGGKKKEGMCGKKCTNCGNKPCSCKKEGMCGSKRKEAFGNFMEEDRLSQERDLQKGQQPYNETVKKSYSNGAKPHESLESEYGGAY